MKHLCLSILMLLSVLSINAQDKNDTDANHNFNEIKVNALYLVLGAFEGIYERTLNEESAVGASLFIPFDDELINDEINFYFSPYYRLYFGKRYAAGFFIEGFGLLSSYDVTTIDFSPLAFDGAPIVREENLTDFALGIGIGGKWVTNNGFIGELNLGIGRNLFNADEFIDDVVAKIGITLGYRF